jgi:hypothetical protein
MSAQQQHLFAGPHVYRALCADIKVLYLTVYCILVLQTADQCTYDYQGIGVCVESVDDNCLLSGASTLRGATLMCGSSSSWVTMRHQAFLYHHQAFGGTVGTGSSRCYALEGSAKICRTTGKLNSTTCLLRNAMCVETVCGAKGGLSAVFRFQDGKDVTVPCPSGEGFGCIDSTACHEPRLAG